MDKLNSAESCETKLLETLRFLSAVCRLTLTGTWEVQITNDEGDPLDALNLSEEARFVTGYINNNSTVKDFLASVIPSEDQENMRNAFNDAVKNRSVYSITHRLIQAGQNERMLYQRGELFFSRTNNQPVKMLCICCDITDYHQSFRSTYKKDEELAFITSHSLRAPLSNIMALSDLLNDVSVDLFGYERIKELLLIIGEQAKHLDEAVRKLTILISHADQPTFNNKHLTNVKELVLIDDEPLANKIHSRLIGSMNPQVNVITFTDPQEGMRYLKESDQQALLLLDINMPVMDAWACLDFMQNNQIRNQVIILSSSINPIDRQKASEFTNVVGFLNKPLTKENIKWIFGKD